MNLHTPSHDLSVSTRHFFKHFPWEKLILWGLLLLGIWIMRNFLAVIFVTFILSYIAHHSIQYITRHSPKRCQHNQWYRRSLVVGIFSIFILSLYLASLLVFPAMMRQGDELLSTVKGVDPVQKFNEVAVNYLGEKKLIEYKHQPNDYDRAFHDYMQTSSIIDPKAAQKTFDQQLITNYGEQQWQGITGSPQYKKIIENIQTYLTTHLGDITLIIATAIKNTASFFIQFFISIIFSFIIVLDIPRLHAQFQSLRATRLKNFYETITPGLVTFSDVLGRAFAAQAVIAVCNTILTYVGMVILEIPLAELMSIFVFFCSFIPVLGVFISSIPISLVALQTHGFVLMLEAIALITLIHIFEAYVLNPRITGNFLKIHPLLVLTVLFVCEHFFGIWGLLLGVPVSVYIFRYAILDMPFPKHSINRG